MSTITGIEVSSDDFWEDSAKTNSEKQNGNIARLDQEELSPIDYKTQAFLSIFLGGLGLHYFNEGHYLKGAATLVGTVSLLCFVPRFAVIMNLTSLVHAWHLSQGTCKDSAGKLIRQVIQLKKEEISSIDHGVALVLNILTGAVGGHHFYSGKPLKGILTIITAGGFCGIWPAINIYQLVTCGFRSGDGKIVCPSYIKESIKD